MFSQLCQTIRELTLQAAELVDNNEIEQCQTVLIKRQSLLEELMHQYQLSAADEAVNDTFVTLIHWLQQQDAINNAKVIDLKDRNKQDTVAQFKINKALHHYKNIT